MLHGQRAGGSGEGLESDQNESSDYSEAWRRILPFAIDFSDHMQITL